MSHVDDGSAVGSVASREESLPEFLADRARRATLGRLLAHASGGLIGGLAAFYWGGPGWEMLLSANVVFFAFGTWSIAGRALDDQVYAGRPSARMLRAVRILAGTAGLLAAAFFMLSFLGKSIGRIIS